MCSWAPFYIWVCTCMHLWTAPARHCERSSSRGFIFLVEGLLWCLSHWHRQINQGRVNLSRAISAEPSTVLQVCLFILHVSFEPPTPNTHWYIWTCITQEKEGSEEKLSVMKTERHAEKSWLISKKGTQNLIWWPMMGFVQSQVTTFCDWAFFQSCSAPMQRKKPCRHYLGNLTKWNRRKLLCEYVVVIISIFKMLKTAKDYALHFMHFILAGLFLKLASLFFVSH